MKIIAALNALNTPWVAIIVVIIGCVFSVVSHSFGMGSDAASGIIGAGIGLLTGQALHASLNPTQGATMPQKD